MAKNKNTYEKRRKEMERMRKAEEKRQRRFARRKGPVQPDAPVAPSPEQGTEQDAGGSIGAQDPSNEAELEVRA